MSELATGFYWMEVFREAEKHGRTVEVTLKNNPEDAFEGSVAEISQGIVRIVDFDDEEEFGTFILLDEIAAVLVMKGDKD